MTDTPKEPKATMTLGEIISGEASAVPAPHGWRLVLPGLEGRQFSKSSTNIRLEDLADVVAVLLAANSQATLKARMEGGKVVVQVMPDEPPALPLPDFEQPDIPFEETERVRKAACEELDRMNRTDLQRAIDTMSKPFRDWL